MTVPRFRVIRKVNKEDCRVETGAVEFGDDWAGIFIRGDDCFQLMFLLDSIKSDKSFLLNHPMHQFLVDDLIEYIYDATGKRL